MTPFNFSSCTQNNFLHICLKNSPFTHMFGNSSIGSEHSRPTPEFILEQTLYHVKLHGFTISPLRDLLHLLEMKKFKLLPNCISAPMRSEQILVHRGTQNTTMPPPLCPSDTSRPINYFSGVSHNFVFSFIQGHTTIVFFSS